MATSDPTDAVALDAGPAPTGKAAEELAPVGTYPPRHRPASVTVLGPGAPPTPLIPPPPPPTAMVGRHVTIQNSGLPGIDGESGYVRYYNVSNQRYNVLLNSGLAYYFASHILQLTPPPAEAVQLPPMQKHPLPARVATAYKPPPVVVGHL